MLRNPRISTRLWVMATSQVLLLAAVAVGVALVLNQVEIGSARYEEILQAKDLATDLQSPSASLVEAHLVVHQLAVAAASDGPDGPREARVDRLEGLERDYQDRHDFWLRALEDPTARQALLTAQRPAQRYFETVHAQLLPALAAGDAVLARDLVEGPLGAAYATHRAATAVVAEIAAAQQASAEAAAAAEVRASRVALLASGLLLLLAVAVLGATTVRTITRRVRTMASAASTDLPRVVAAAIRSAETGAEPPTLTLTMQRRDDELADAERALDAVARTAVALAGEQAHLRRTTSAMLVSLGRRNHMLLSRTRSYVAELERAEDNPAGLERLARIEHLTSRMRRNAESLLVLAGSSPLSTWSEPVDVADVVRCALSEVEDYDRVDVGVLDPIAVHGNAVSDLAHLLAELLENAATFSDPLTRVLIAGRREAQTYTLSVSDDGVGISSAGLPELNRRLAGNSIEVADPRRLGLDVVGRLAARHQIVAVLDHSLHAGVVARVQLPGNILTDILAPIPPAGGLTRRVRGVHPATPRRVEEPTVRQLSADSVRSSLASLAAGQRAANEHSGVAP